jgi:hypothetical protein
MANNALIQGAADTGKKFLDVGQALAVGSMGGTSIAPKSVPNRVAENKAIQGRVNSYMGKMKTDMDFTSFSPSETKSMRSFLVSQRSIYANAAKEAAKFEDTTNPEYMAYVDTMQGVNNSFTNLASQLKFYKKSKVDYAKTMQEGLYSNGNPTAKSEEAAIIYGFYDSDGDKRSDDRYDAPFQIQNGGNIAFNVRGKEVTYNGMEEPFLKDTKFLNGLNKSTESAYNSGLSGNNENPYSLDSYKQELNDSLQNEDTLRSIIFDFEAEADMKDIGVKLESGEIDLAGARTEVAASLTQAREEAYTKGKKEYDREQAKVDAPKQTSSQIAASKKITKKLELLDNGQQITAMSGSALRTAKLAPVAHDPGEEFYWMTDDAGNPIEEYLEEHDKFYNKNFTRDEVIDKLNLYNK